MSRTRADTRSASRQTHTVAELRGIIREIATASAVHSPGGMTRFDRMWEPLLVVVAAVIVWIGTLL